MGETGARILVVDDERFFREGDPRDPDRPRATSAPEVEDGEARRSTWPKADPADTGVVVLDVRQNRASTGFRSPARAARASVRNLRVIMLSRVDRPGAGAGGVADRRLRLPGQAAPRRGASLLAVRRMAGEGYAAEAEWDAPARAARPAGVRLHPGAARRGRRQMRGRRSRAGPGSFGRRRRLAAEVTRPHDGKTSLMLLEATVRQRALANGGGVRSRHRGSRRWTRCRWARASPDLALRRSEPLVVNLVADDERFAGRAPAGRYRSGRLRRHRPCWRAMRKLGSAQL